MLPHPDRMILWGARPHENCNLALQMRVIDNGLWCFVVVEFQTWGTPLHPTTCCLGITLSKRTPKEQDAFTGNWLLELRPYIYPPWYLRPNRRTLTQMLQLFIVADRLARASTRKEPEQLQHTDTKSVTMGIGNIFVPN